MKKLGLTGGIGVGKTYVSRVFQRMGIPIFNTDIEAKKCMVEDKGLIQSIKNSFGENIYDNNILQKEKLAKIVFNNSERLSELNVLVHPILNKKFYNWCEQQTAKLVIKEAAILFESDAHLELDAVICVSATEEERIERVQKRDGSSVAEIRNRMDKQMPQSRKEELADFVILNDGEQLLLPQLIRVLKGME
jgi:dephospho-CoA kinase